MARKAASSAIRFTRDFDHIEPGRTTAYKAGHVVDKPTQALVEAAGDRAEPAEVPIDDGE